MFDRLIENFVAFEDVDPNRVYLMGYSAGGDGVYQLAPRMADRWAAAAMMAGHPNNARPDSLRNTSFTLHVGEHNAPYNRNEVAAEWKRRLAELRRGDPNGYDHWAEIHEGKGHWMDGDDAVAVPWMARRTRLLRPHFVLWRQHGSVTHRRFYWLAVDGEPQPGKTITARLSDQSAAGCTIELSADSGPLRIRLDDQLCDLERGVRVVRGGREVYRGRPARTILTLHRTLGERGDPTGMFSSEIVMDHEHGPWTMP